MTYTLDMLGQAEKATGKAFGNPDMVARRKVSRGIPMS